MLAKSLLMIISNADIKLVGRIFDHIYKVHNTFSPSISLRALDSLEIEVLPMVCVGGWLATSEPEFTRANRVDPWRFELHAS